ncbi:hypothetical protein [Endozoicomonas sp.]
MKLTYESVIKLREHPHSKHFNTNIEVMNGIDHILLFERWVIGCDS